MFTAHNNLEYTHAGYFALKTGPGPRPVAVHREGGNVPVLRPDGEQPARRGVDAGGSAEPGAGDAASAPVSVDEDLEHEPVLPDREEAALGRPREGRRPKLGGELLPEIFELGARRLADRRPQLVARVVWFQPTMKIIKNGRCNSMITATTKCFLGMRY